MLFIIKKILLSIFVILSVLSLAYSEENSDSEAIDYSKDRQLMFFASTDIVNKNGLNTTLGFISCTEIFNNKVIPISAFTELNYSIPVIKDSSMSFSCLNAGLRFSRRITDTWSFGISIGSGIALFDEQVSVNSTASAFLTYRSFSIMCIIRGIVSDKSNASCTGFGLSYCF